LAWWLVLITSRGEIHRYEGIEATDEMGKQLKVAVSIN
jgi:hypothetical protein